MRDVAIFAGSSHRRLTEAICERLGAVPAPCKLGKFSNGETSVEIGASVRNKDVFVVQSGSEKINDAVMELLIMINACKGGSARSVTAVMPYFPYARQSKKKSHRGAITARMLANLLSVAGVDHIISVDLHASQMQGFFSQPVDNLFAEPLIARWIRLNVPRWQHAVVVSKNAGGSKRVTSLADTLKLNFGIVTTERRRKKPPFKHITESAVFFDTLEVVSDDYHGDNGGSSKGSSSSASSPDAKSGQKTVQFEQDRPAPAADADDEDDGSLRMKEKPRKRGGSNTSSSGDATVRPLRTEPAVQVERLAAPLGQVPEEQAVEDDENDEGCCA
ncbi:hypothetical protein KEM52_004196, partial [Ascosphaera acerosa]